MNNRKIILFIAMSLDGFIAKENGDISFLNKVERPNENYFYFDFLKTVDTVIMGRKTYDKVKGFGIEFPHKDRKCYVISRNLKGKNEDIEYFNGNIEDLIYKLKTNNGKNIFIDGGAEIVNLLIKRNLIDKYVISIIPTILGEGVRLFSSDNKEVNLKMIKTYHFQSGLVQIWYDKNET